MVLIKKELWALKWIMKDQIKVWKWKAVFHKMLTRWNHSYLSRLISEIKITTKV